LVAYLIFDFSKLYDLIEQFKTQYPNVKFVIEQGSPMELSNGLTDDDYDLVLNLEDYIPHNNKIKTSLFKTNNLQVAIQNNHKLATKKEIKFSDLADETLILIERNKSPLVFDYVINKCL
jgi:DNA-binding transcriptional LysR family regulator